jgi:catalase
MPSFRKAAPKQRRPLTPARRPSGPAATGVQLNLGVGVGADAAPAAQQSAPAKATTGHDPALSMATTAKANAGKTGILTRHVAILATDGADVAAIGVLMQALMDQGAQTAIVATLLGTQRSRMVRNCLLTARFKPRPRCCLMPCTWPVGPPA